jgi:hypothetical protein
MRYDSIFVIFFVVSGTMKCCDIFFLTICALFLMIPGTTKCYDYPGTTIFAVPGMKCYDDDFYPVLEYSTKTICALFLMVSGTTKCCDYPGTTIFAVPGTKCYDDDFYPVLEYSTIFALPRMTMSTCYGDFSPIFVNFYVNES